MWPLSGTRVDSEVIFAGRKDSRTCIDSKLVETSGQAIVDEGRTGGPEPLPVVPAHGGLQVQIALPVVVSRGQHPVNVSVSAVGAVVKIEIQTILNIGTQNNLAGDQFRKSMDSILATARPRFVGRTGVPTSRPPY